MIVLSKRELFAMLPSVDEVLSDNRIVEIINEYPRSLVLESVREVIDLKRQFILRLKEDASNSVTIEFGEIIESAIERVKLNYSLSLKKVINATGTVIHTNLGRSLLSEDIKMNYGVLLQGIQT